MKEKNEKIPDPKEIEKELGNFLAKKFGDNVKIVSPMVSPRENPADSKDKPVKKKKKLNFNLKPEELIDYLDQYVVKQQRGKEILSTKICTHFNRIKRSETTSDDIDDMIGGIKNNVLMLGPTGVGKTYIIKLIAQKIGVPFVKGDATKFSETGYVGGDVEDLVRDLLREADDDIELAQCGIIYLDEIDKIAASHNLIGADVSRTGVQRALLKPLEETEVELKVPHDPISMIQEIERFRKTGKREKRVINTKNILFIMSGAFSDLSRIVQKRVKDQGIGFGAHVTGKGENVDILKHVSSEDLIKFGFESEFVGRLPVRAVFEKLEEDDLFEILNNPNNPIILGKKLDFASYGITVKFEEKVLRVLAKNAFKENTGARGLVSAVEEALLPFEKRLPSTRVKKFAVTADIVDNPEETLEAVRSSSEREKMERQCDHLALKERDAIKAYIVENQKRLSAKYNLTLTSDRIDITARYYSDHIMDMGKAIKKIKSHADEIKKIELFFFKNHDINIVLEDDAIDFLIRQIVDSDTKIEEFYQKLADNLEYGLKLVREKTGKKRFFITREALVSPEAFVRNLISTDSSQASGENAPA